MTGISELIFLFVGLFLGGLIAWFIAKSRFSSHSSDSEHGRTIAELEAKLSVLNKNLEEKGEERNSLREDLERERRESEDLAVRLAERESELKHLNLKLAEDRENLELIKKNFTTEFHKLAQDIFDEKGKKFTELNKSNIGDLLNPLKERIEKFEEKVDKTSKENLQWNSTLKEQISNLKDLNLQITKEAENLTKALKGDSKAQGNWGEMQLEVILEKSGLEEGVHYEKEVNLKNEDGANQRPDYIIRLPDDKCLILDSKVSLTAYANYFDEEEDDQKAKYLKQHIASVNKHISDLKDRNYQNLYQINQPDYIMMFVANEPALTMALKEDQALYEKALERNIVLVSSTTLMATLRTISYIWKQDLQNKNAQEIARRAGDLYDKFVGFIEDLDKVGKHLNSTKGSYDEAMKKLVEGKGNLVRRTEQLRELGVKSSKSLDQRYLDRSEE